MTRPDRVVIFHLHKQPPRPVALKWILGSLEPLPFRFGSPRPWTSRRLRLIIELGHTNRDPDLGAALR